MTTLRRVRSCHVFHWRWSCGKEKVESISSPVKLSGRHHQTREVCLDQGDFRRPDHWWKDVWGETGDDHRPFKYAELHGKNSHILAAMKREEFDINDHICLTCKDFKWWVSSVKSFLNTKASKNSSQQATKSSYSRRRHPTDPSNKYGKRGSVRISTVIRLRVYLTQSIRF